MLEIASLTSSTQKSYHRQKVTSPISITVVPEILLGKMFPSGKLIVLMNQTYKAQLRIAWGPQIVNLFSW